MAYLLSGDLDTHIYSENKDEIVRADNEIITKAISASIAEAKYYIRKYDILKIFGTDVTEAVIEDETLKDKVKDLVVWKLVKLGNPNINVEMARTCYEDAIKWFEKIQAGKVDPGWPMPLDDDETDYNENDTIQWDSNPKRNNFF